VRLPGCAISLSRTRLSALSHAAGLRC